LQITSAFVDEKRFDLENLGNFAGPLCCNPPCDRALAGCAAYKPCHRPNLYPWRVQPALYTRLSLLQ
jgi:hypothetical protein